MLTYTEADGTEQKNLFHGSVQTDPNRDTISGFFEGCGGSYEFRELARIFPASTVNDSFSFSADSIFQSTALPSFENQLVVDSCKYVLKRDSTAPPEIETCD
jgi:hypothetical protein